MRALFLHLKRLATDDRGASAVEYGLILAMVVLAMFGALASVGGGTRDMWNNVSSRVMNAH